MIVGAHSKIVTKARECKVCGAETPPAIGGHARTTCSKECASKAAQASARMKVDSYYMPLEEVGRYLDLLDAAEIAPSWKSRILLSEASRIRRD
jgi:hypothetical protein